MQNNQQGRSKAGKTKQEKLKKKTSYSWHATAKISSFCLVYIRWYPLISLNFFSEWLELKRIRQHRHARQLLVMLWAKCTPSCIQKSWKKKTAPLLVARLGNPGVWWDGQGGHEKQLWARCVKCCLLIESENWICMLAVWVLKNMTFQFHKKHYFAYVEWLPFFLYRRMNEDGILLGFIWTSFWLTVTKV